MKRKKFEKNKYYSELLDAAGLEDLIEEEEGGETPGNEETQEDGVTEEAQEKREAQEDEETEGDGKSQDNEESPDPEDGERRLKRTVQGVLLLIALFTLIELLVVLFFIGGETFVFGELKLACVLGLLIGAGMAMLLFLLMKRQIETVLDLPENSAKNRLRLGSILRIVSVMALAVLFAFLMKYIHPLAFLVGVLNLKAAALLQPLLDKFLKKE